jgi:hypothetical protein
MMSEIVPHTNVSEARTGWLNERFSAIKSQIGAKS